MERTRSELLRPVLAQEKREPGSGDDPPIDPLSSVAGGVSADVITARVSRNSERRAYAKGRGQIDREWAEPSADRRKGGHGVLSVRPFGTQAILRRHPSE